MNNTDKKLKKIENSNMPNNSAMTKTVIFDYSNNDNNEEDYVEDDIYVKLVAFVSSFDGSPQAWSNAKPIMVDIYDENLIMKTQTNTTSAGRHDDDNVSDDSWRSEYDANDEGDEVKHQDLEFFMKLASKFAGDLNIAKVESVSVIDNGVKISIRNIINGTDIGITEQSGAIGPNGKFVSWETMPSNVIDILNTTIDEDKEGNDHNVVGSVDGSFDDIAVANNNVDLCQQRE
jgi:hypothetical protein